MMNLIQLGRKPLEIEQLNPHTVLQCLTTHSANLTHNLERYEVLGDTVLKLFVSLFLFRRYPDYHEGQMTQMRSALTQNVSLARLARQWDLQDKIIADARVNMWRPAGMLPDENPKV